MIALYCYIVQNCGGTVFLRRAGEFPYIQDLPCTTRKQSKPETVWSPDVRSAAGPIQPDLPILEMLLGKANYYEGLAAHILAAALDFIHVSNKIDGNASCRISRVGTVTSAS